MSAPRIMTPAEREVRAAVRAWEAAARKAVKAKEAESKAWARLQEAQCAPRIGDELLRLYERTKLAWMATIETAETVDRATRAEEAAASAAEFWNLALSCADHEPTHAAEILRDAAWLAADWGDDAPERAAIALLTAADFDDGVSK